MKSRLRSRRLLKTRLYVEKETRGMSSSQKIAYAKRCRSSSPKCKEAKAFARSSSRFKRSKRSRSRKMSSRLTKYQYFNPEEPYDEDRIKNCHRFQWKTFEGGARFRTRPSGLWCKEAKHFLKSLKKSKIARKNEFNVLYTGIELTL
jgi:hypothetical protein